jgi:DNA polymerase elongation subunit (family B)
MALLCAVRRQLILHHWAELPHEPATADDVYRRLIDLRNEVKTARDAAKAAGDRDLAARLDAEQLALKITANATAYGIFVELNAQELDRLTGVRCYGPTGAEAVDWNTADAGFLTRVRNVEEEGRYFHPLLATLITGAARLMLALSEHAATEFGLEWGVLRH